MDATTDLYAVLGRGHRVRAVGDSFFLPALRGRTVRTVGSLDAPHTMS